MIFSLLDDHQRLCNMYQIHEHITSVVMHFLRKERKGHILENTIKCKSSFTHIKTYMKIFAFLVYKNCNFEKVKCNKCSTIMKCNQYV